MKSFVVMLALAGCVSAAEIRWSGKGAVSSISGGSFSETGVQPSDEVEFEMVYDSETLTNGRSYLPIDGAIAGRAWFYGEVSLAITVKIGGNVWTGEMASLPSSVNVMESVCWDGGGNPDWFAVNLDAARGGNFPTFPQTGNETTKTLNLEFRDDTSPAELFDVHVLPDSVTNLCEMTSATGSVMVGSSTISFSIDPASVRIVMPGVPTSITKLPDGIELSWETLDGKNYRIEGSSDLRCWSSEGIYSGTGELRVEKLLPFGVYARRFFRVVEL